MLANNNTQCKAVCTVEFALQTAIYPQKEAAKRTLYLYI